MTARRARQARKAADRTAGLRGAGKTSLGQALADQLGAPFLEISKEVEDAYGGDLGLLIELGGQSALHRYESETWDAIIRNLTKRRDRGPGGIVADGPLFERVLSTAHTIGFRRA